MLDRVPVDFETFWSDTHSLSKMSPIEYVQHKDTQIISVSATPVGETKPQVAFGEKNVRALLRECELEKYLAIAHNMSGFDAMILAWRLGIIPRMWGCTLAMARPIHAKTTGLSLRALVLHYGIGVKEGQVLIDTKGKRLEDFSPTELARMGTYNGDDTWQCNALFDCLLPHYSAMELWAIDWSIRMLVQPQLHLDQGLLETALVAERTNKRTSLLALAQQLREGRSDIEWSDEDAALKWLKKELSSSAKFVSLLESLGVPTPTKPSPSDPEKRIPAVSKTDKAMETLCDHPVEVVAAAARERLAVKSTQTETRLTHFLNVSRVVDGKWPVTTHYCGADTTGRRSGWLYNPLNLNRINKKKPKTADALRRSIIAPPGKRVVVADLSGVEMRFNHHLWAVPYSCDMWRNNPKADLYRASAAKALGCTPEEVTDLQRQAAKVENLGLGFGMGAIKFVDAARILSYGELNYTLEEAVASVKAWRSTHIEIVRGWRTCHLSLEDIYAGRERAIDPAGMFVTCKEGIRLPSGRIIRYPKLHIEYEKETGQEEWWYGEGRNRSRIYAGKIDENIVQAGARDAMYEIIFDVFRMTGHRPALEVYDEGVWVIDEDKAEEFLELVLARMKVPPKWFQHFVLWAEGSIAQRYGDAK